MAYHIQRATGKAHDLALESTKAGKDHFKQYTRCGHWVCPDMC